MKLFEIAVAALVIIAVVFIWHYQETLTNVLMPIFRNISDGLIG